VTEDRRRKRDREETEREERIQSEREKKDTNRHIEEEEREGEETQRIIAHTNFKHQTPYHVVWNKSRSSVSHVYAHHATDAS
jgi:hypothetical protein